ncbi:MAG: HlyD family efflux transporter periplasmic adaptor subunit [Desulfobulbaceae bacterium]|nr:MAG: HlyD family efflux transporter periplasmic adaptor subunit [Desulfobulbaceae bacterium]
MSQEIDFDEILAKYRLDPYNYIDITAPHTGVVNFFVEKGNGVDAPSGEWNHIPGTPLFQIIRERNEKAITAPISGIVSEIRIEFQGQFVEAGEKLLTIRHPLKKKDIIEAILKEVLYLFPAPETAKFFFSMDIQSRIDQKGAGGVTIRPGDEAFTMSLMKRDTPVYYSGEEGVIHSIYFRPGISVPQGEPLIGVCPADKLPLIQKVITRVKAEWDAM